MKYQSILTSYPEYISKEQMYRICHISKKTCLYLLESGLVPCIDNGKQTRRFTIKTTDVVAYLCARDLNPKVFQAPVGYYSTTRKNTWHQQTQAELEAIRLFYKNLLSAYPEVMRSHEVASFTGYSKTSVNIWCKKGLLKHYYLHQQYKIPQAYLVDFLVSDYFTSITEKSKKHRWFNEQIKKIYNCAKK